MSKELTKKTDEITHLLR